MSTVILLLLLFGVYKTAYSSHTRVKRVINGEEVTSLTQYPFQVVITFRTMYQCTGVILDKRKVLTAAGCFLERGKIKENKSYKVTGGALTFRAFEDEPLPSWQRVQVEKIYEHPCYRPTGSEDVTRSSKHDLALIILAADLKFNEFVGPIPIASADLLNSTEKVSAFFLGRGKKGNPKFGGVELYDVIQHAPMDIFPQSECSKKDPPYSALFDEGLLICAESPVSDSRNKARGCTDDRGGPLVIMDKNNGSASLAGLFTLTTPCGRHMGRPMIFVNVHAYVEWIASPDEPTDMCHDDEDTPGAGGVPNLLPNPVLILFLIICIVNSCNLR